jgi:hypothetical protein
MLGLDYARSSVPGPGPTCGPGPVPWPWWSLVIPGPVPWSLVALCDLWPWPWPWSALALCLALARSVPDTLALCLCHMPYARCGFSHLAVMRDFTVVCTPQGKTRPF